MILCTHWVARPLPFPLRTIFVDMQVLTEFTLLPFINSFFSQTFPVSSDLYRDWQAMSPSSIMLYVTSVYAIEV